MYIQPPGIHIVHTRGQQCIMNQSQIDVNTVPAIKEFRELEEIINANKQ